MHLQPDVSSKNIERLMISFIYMFIAIKLAKVNTCDRFNAMKVIKIHGNRT